MKFTIDNKELKRLLKQAIAGVDTKANWEPLTRLKFMILMDELHIIGSNSISYVDAYTTDVEIVDDVGNYSIYFDDAKLLLKMSGEVTFEYDDVLNKVKITSGNRKINIRGWSCNGVLFAGEKTHVMDIEEGHLVKVINALSKFTVDVGIKHYININFAEKRFEACEGSCIAIRDFSSEVLDDSISNMMIHRKYFKLIKGTMSSKSKDIVRMSVSDEFVLLEKDGLKCVIKAEGDEFLRISELLDDVVKAPIYKFRFNRNEALIALKDSLNLSKEKNVFLYKTKDKIYIYTENRNSSMVESVETEDIENNSEEDLIILFNTQYLIDVLSGINADNVECHMTGYKSPVMFYGEEFRFLVLPKSYDINKGKRIVETITKEI